MSAAAEKEPCLVAIENYELMWLKLISMHTRNMPMKTVFIVPASCSEDFFQGLPCRVIRTADFSFEALDRIVQPLAEKYRLIGLGTPYGLFAHGGKGPLGPDVSRLAEKYGCRRNDPDAVYRAGSKFLMRERLRELGVPSARHALISRVEDCAAAGREVGFPAITKPSVGGCSAFVRISRNMAELEEAYRHYAAKAKQSYFPLDWVYDYGGRSFDNASELLCEEYLDGPEFAVETLCLEDQVIPLIIHEKFNVTHNATTVLEPIFVAPATALSPEDARRIEEYTVEVCRALGLKNCFCHFELRLTARGPIVCEVNPRVGGCRVKENIEAFYGLGFGDIFLAYATREHPLPAIVRRDIGVPLLGMTVLFTEKTGRIEEIQGWREVLDLPGVCDVKSSYKVGDWVDGENAEMFLAYVGYGANDAEDLLRKDALIRETLRFVVKP